MPPSGPASRRLKRRVMTSGSAGLARRINELALIRNDHAEQRAVPNMLAALSISARFVDRKCLHLAMIADCDAARGIGRINPALILSCSYQTAIDHLSKSRRFTLDWHELPVHRRFTECRLIGTRTPISLIDYRKRGGDELAICSRSISHAVSQRQVIGLIDGWRDCRCSWSAAYRARSRNSNRLGTSTTGRARLELRLRFRVITVSIVHYARASSACVANFATSSFAVDYS